MLSLKRLLVGVALIAGLSGGALLLSNPADSPAEVRLVARPLADGRVEVGLQQRPAADGWGGIALPDARFLRPDAATGKWRTSSPLTLERSEPALVCMVTHSRPGDRFWERVHATAASAAERASFQLRIHGEPDGATRARLIRDCLAEGAVAIATTLSDSEALAEALLETRESGVELVTFNSGADEARAVSSRFHVALNETAAGRQAANLLLELELNGEILCVVHEANNLGLDRRCNGLANTARGTHRVSRLEAHETGVSDLDGTLAAITARIDEGGVGAVVALNGVIGRAAAERIEERGLDIVVGTFGSDPSLLPLVADGRLLFVVSDRPVMQASLTISAVEELLYGAWNDESVIGENTTRLQIDPVLIDRDAATVP